MEQETHKVKGSSYFGTKGSLHAPRVAELEVGWLRSEGGCFLADGDVGVAANEDEI